MNIHRNLFMGFILSPAIFLSLPVFGEEPVDVNEESSGVIWEIPEQDSNDSWEMGQDNSAAADGGGQEGEQRQWEQAIEPSEQPWETLPESDEVEEAE